MNRAGSWVGLCCGGGGLRTSIEGMVESGPGSGSGSGSGSGTRRSGPYEEEWSKEMTGKAAGDIDIEIVCCHFLNSCFSLVLKG